MDADLEHWPGSYSSHYNSMDNNEHYVEPDDIEYASMHYSLIPDPADIVGLVQPSIPTSFLHALPFSDTSHDPNAIFFSSGNTSTNQRLQTSPPLHINTQLSSLLVNGPESSTASSTSFRQVLQTPPFQSYHGIRPSIHIASPCSAPAESGMLMPDLEKMSPLPASPMSFYSSHFEGDMLDAPLLPEPDVVTQSPLPHILEWKRVMEQCGTNDFVPQTVYQPYTEADKKRYILEAKLHDTIFFVSEGSSELGISLDDALKQRLRHLKDKDDRMFTGCGPSVSIRIQWPGYPAWSKQIPTKDFKTPKGQITRAKLAKNIATCVRHFAERVQNKPMEAGSDPRWKIGKRHIKVEDLILVSLHHVSKGSWQPQFRLRKGLFNPFSFQWDESLQSVSASR